MLDGAATKLGRKCGEVPVDFGAIAIADFEQVRRSLDDADQAKLNEWAVQFMTINFCEKHGTAIGTKAIQFVVCNSGFGDGTYPVFRLNCKGRPVGLEVELYCLSRNWRTRRSA